MQLLRDRIRRDGNVRPGNILKVDSFLNHQIDPQLFLEIGREFKRRFEGEAVTKIITVEASGIAVALAAGLVFEVPVLFAKKSQSKNLDGDIYHARVESYTRGTVFDIQVSKRFLTEGDSVLILDDFLAKGKALMGLIDIVRQSGAALVGCGIVIEKGFQEGGEMLRKEGIRVESLAIVDAMDETGITFRGENPA